MSLPVNLDKSLVQSYREWKVRDKTVRLSVQWHANGQSEIQLNSSGAIRRLIAPYGLEEGGIVLIPLMLL